MIVNASIGVCCTDLAVPGTEIEVEIYGQRHARPRGQPLWDPKNERLRA